jgi:GAF domain
MFPQSRSRFEFFPEDDPPSVPSPDPAHTLEQHLRTGFSGDLALDLVLNDLVGRAAEATGATAAALALVRGDEMVCRAATGKLAPDLGAPLSPRDGLSGDCLKTHQPQISDDTQFDSRVDPEVPLGLGIRSILIVPVFDKSSDDRNHNNHNNHDTKARFAGVLEVFSTAPGAFGPAELQELEKFAEECSRIRQDVLELTPHKPKASASPLSEIALPRILEAEPSSGIVEHDLTLAGFAPAIPPPSPSYDFWTLFLGALAILAIIAVSFLIGYRIGWVHPAVPRAQIAQPLPADPGPVEPAAAPPSERTKPVRAKSTAKSARTAKSEDAPPLGDDLVVYEKGKVIFRLKPDSAKANQSKPSQSKPAGDAVVPASSTSKIADPKQPR